jgi:energy-coupling factor transporter ATP-binding protein EcfA2
MITRIEAIRYRCYERLGVDLGNFHVVVGANGSGKTTLLDIPVLFGELIRADYIGIPFNHPRSDKPARAANLRDLIFAGRGDDFSLALEAHLPENIQKKWADSLIARAKSKRSADKIRNNPRSWPTHIRYEIRLELLDDRELSIKNEYLFVFPETSTPDRDKGGLAADRAIVSDDWHFILRREYGGQAKFNLEVDPIQGSGKREEQISTQSNILAMSTVKYQPDAYPAAFWLYQLLTTGVVFLDPDWTKLHAASMPGQAKTLIPSALNLPWLALELKLSGLSSDADEQAKSSYRSQDYTDWVEHVKTALPQVEDIDIRTREDDFHAYFTIRYAGGYSVTSSGLSDGTLRILVLTLSAYIGNPPRLLVTEEPENGIHPGAIEAILESLSSLYDSQVWVSSHSPVVLASTRLDQLLCARLTASGGVELVAGNDHPRLKDWHGAIDLGSLFAAGILG